MGDSIVSHYVPQIRKHDGYAGEEIWKKEKNSSMYYDYNIDKQFTVPVTSPAELQEKYELKNHDV